MRCLERSASASNAEPSIPPSRPNPAFALWREPWRILMFLLSAADTLAVRLRQWQRAWVRRWHW